MVEVLGSCSTRERSVRERDIVFEVPDTNPPYWQRNEDAGYESKSRVPEDKYSDVDPCDCPLYMPACFVHEKLESISLKGIAGSSIPFFITMGVR